MAERRKRAEIPLFFRTLHTLLFGAGILVLVGLWCFYDCFCNPRFFWLLMVWIFVGRHAAALPVALVQWLLVKQCYQCHAPRGKETHAWHIDGKERPLCAECNAALEARQEPYLEQPGGGEDARERLP